MARKTLLTESELRRFMKLADMRPAGEKRIQEMGGPYPGARDEEEDELHATEDELGHEDHVADAEADELDVADDELAMDAPMDEPMDDLGAEEAPVADPALEAKFAEFMTQVAEVAQEVLGIEVDVEEAPAADDELGGEEVVDAELDVMDVEPEGVPEEGGELEVGPDVEEEDPEAAMVAEVARRVAARLQKESHQAEVVDQLAERIMKRLTK